MSNKANDDLSAAVMSLILDRAVSTDAVTGKTTAVLDSLAITKALSDVIALVCHTSQQVDTPRGRRLFGEEIGKGIALMIAVMQQAGVAKKIGLETLNVTGGAN